LRRYLNGKAARNVVVLIPQRLPLDINDVINQVPPLLLKELRSISHITVHQDGDKQMSSISHIPIHQDGDKEMLELRRHSPHNNHVKQPRPLTVIVLKTSMLALRTAISNIRIHNNSLVD
jgi:hypothetical protein